VSVFATGLIFNHVEKTDAEYRKQMQAFRNGFREAVLQAAHEQKLPKSPWDFDGAPDEPEESNEP
jgi:hypothetical protein